MAVSMLLPWQLLSRKSTTYIYIYMAVSMLLPWQILSEKATTDLFYNSWARDCLGAGPFGSEPIWAGVCLGPGPFGPGPIWARAVVGGAGLGRLGVGDCRLAGVACILVKLQCPAPEMRSFSPCALAWSINSKRPLAWAAHIMPAAPAPTIIVSYIMVKGCTDLK